MFYNKSGANCLGVGDGPAIGDWDDLGSVSLLNPATCY